jgi:hypothetical protein
VSEPLSEVNRSPTSSESGSTDCRLPTVLLWDGEYPISDALMPDHVPLFERTRRVSELFAPIREVDDEGAHRLLEEYR